MLAADAGDVVVASISALAVIIGAGFGMYGVIYSTRAQKRPRIVDLEPNQAKTELVACREKCERLRAERNVWKQIALECQANHGGQG